MVVCQPQDDTRALFGGLSAEALKLKGVRGDIVDGGCRDIQAVADPGFPVFARYATPIDIVCAWRAEAFDPPPLSGFFSLRVGFDAQAEVTPALFGERRVRHIGPRYMQGHANRCGEAPGTCSRIATDFVTGLFGSMLPFFGTVIVIGLP